MWYLDVVAITYSFTNGIFVYWNLWFYINTMLSVLVFIIDKCVYLNNYFS